MSYDLLGDQSSLLGTGASASVWSAKVRSSGEYVAVKTVCREAYSKDVSHTESDVLWCLQNVPGVVRIIDSFDDGDQEIIIMELCAGLDLQQWSQSEMSLRTIKSIVFNLLLTLRDVHLQGYTHMDIRLENVVAVRAVDADDVSIKLVDFGSSINSNAEAFVDIQNTGKLLYELLTGHRFSGDFAVSSLKSGNDLDDQVCDLMGTLVNVDSMNYIHVTSKAILHGWFRELEPMAPASSRTAGTSTF